MLVLKRKLGESIMIGHDIKITILERSNLHMEEVKIEIDVPTTVPVHRSELYDEIKATHGLQGMPVKSIQQTRTDEDKLNNY